jgi:hypothetical protein
MKNNDIQMPSMGNAFLSKYRRHGISVAGKIVRVHLNAVGMAYCERFVLRTANNNPKEILHK